VFTHEYCTTADGLYSATVLMPEGADAPASAMDDIFWSITMSGEKRMGSFNTTFILDYDTYVGVWEVRYAQNSVDFQQTCEPSSSPSAMPTKLGQTNAPSISLSPAVRPTESPVRQSLAPTAAPSSTQSPTRALETASPSAAPTESPTAAPVTPGPTVSGSPTLSPTLSPSLAPNTVAPPPVIEVSGCVGTENSITASYAISGPGVIFCGAFEFGTVPDVTSLWSISSVAPSWVWSSHDEESVGNAMEIGNLKSNVPYTVVCYTSTYVDSDSALLTDFEVTYVSSCSATTGGVSTVSVISDVSRLVAGEVSDPIAIELDYSFFDESLVISPVVYFSSSVEDENCEGTVLKSSLTPAQSLLSPSSLVFDGQSVGLTQFVFVQPVSAGCLFILIEDTTLDGGVFSPRVNMSSPTKSFVDDNGLLRSALSIRVYADDQAVAASPKISKAFLSIDGSSMVVDYVAATDMGVSAGLQDTEFACSELLLFSGSDESTCRFTSPRQVVATLASAANGDTVTVGDAIQVTAGIVKSDCLAQTDTAVCSTYPFQADSSEVLQASVSRYDVFPLIAGPSIVSLCADIDLDITGSVGHGGRPWSQLSWEVYTSSTNTHFPGVLEDHLNGLQWSDCIMGSASCNNIPATLFPYGDVTFVLYMTNFLGVTGMTTHTISRVSGSFPVSTLNSPHRVMATQQALRTTLVRSNEDCSHLNITSAKGSLSVGWSMMDGSEAVAGVVTTSYQLSLPSEVLSTGHMYTVEATVLDELSKSSASSELIYVSRAPVGASIGGGSFETVAFDRTVRLDAGDSYSGAGASVAVVYWWTCFQVSPTLDDSCSAALNVRNASTLEIAASSLSADATYVFTVYVGDASFAQRFSSRAHKTVFVSSMVSPDVSAQIGGVRGPALAEYAAPLDYTAVVSFSESTVVSWSLSSPLDVALSTETFPAGGVTEFPLSTLYSSLLPGRSYVFELTVTPTTGCDGACASFVYLFPFQGNYAPSGGELIVSPTTGSATTEFSMTATAWTDADLPLSYTFFSRLNSSEERLLVSPRSQTSFVTSVVQSGLAADLHVVQLEVVVSDIYGYEATSEPFAVTVLSHDQEDILNFQLLLQAAVESGDRDTALTYAGIIELSAFDCAGSDLSTCVSIVDGLVQATTFLAGELDMNTDTSHQLVSLWWDEVSFYSTFVSFTNLSDFSASSSFDALLSAGEALTDVCSAGVCDSSSMDQMMLAFNALADYFGEYGDFLPSSSRRLAATDVEVAASRLTRVNDRFVQVVNLLLHYVVVPGVSMVQKLSNYDVHIEKGWPVLLNTSLLQGGLLLDPLLFDADASLFGFHTVVLSIEPRPSATCANDGLSCTVLSPSMRTSVYVKSTEAEAAQPALSQGYWAEQSGAAPVTSGHVRRNITGTCDAAQTVSLSCDAEETNGYAYAADVVCPDGIPDASNVTLRCPVYEAVSACAVDGQERTDCVVSQSSAAGSLCACPMALEVDSTGVLSATEVTGYKTFTMSSVSVALVGTNIVIAAAVIFPDSSSVSLESLTLTNAVLSTDLLTILVPLQILCCCCILLCCIFFVLRKKRKEDSEKESEADDAFHEHVTDYDSFSDSDSGSDLGDGSVTSDIFGSEEDPGDAFPVGIAAVSARDSEDGNYAESEYDDFTARNVDSFEDSFNNDSFGYLDDNVSYMSDHSQHSQPVPLAPMALETLHIESNEMLDSESETEDAAPVARGHARSRKEIPGGLWNYLFEGEEQPSDEDEDDSGHAAQFSGDDEFSLQTENRRF
jgi:hypothetical protein